ncbi:MAG: NAD(P)-dependent oxidoreductase [Candidatus Competibacteraceae bacterium]|nr:NAD(P)-dependent oxidoreductase [Candidatus Competibacteraceae bacterium]
MRIAVTGATGFIGRHVLSALTQQGVDITAMLRPGTERRVWLKDIPTVEIDLHNPADETFVRLGRPDVLIHLAWAGLPNYKSLHHYEDELPAQYRFLKGLIDGGLSRLVIAGTCFEYGMYSGPLSEEMQPRPANSYGFAKDCLRQQVEYLKTIRPFALTWARLFYTYGEGQPASSLLPQLERAVANGDGVFNMSGGEQLRDYLPVAEVARALVVLAQTDADVGVVNVCSGRPISVRRFVEDWLNERGHSISLNLGHYPYPDYEPMAFWGDRRKLDRILDTK